MNNSNAQPRVQLTEKGLHGLIEEDRKGVIVQILSADQIPNTKPGINNLKFKVVIADGLAKHKAVLGNRAAEVFKNAGAPINSIIKINDVLVKPTVPKKLIIITELVILSQGRNQIVGVPVEYKEWFDQYNEYQILSDIHQKKSQLSRQNTPDHSEASKTLYSNKHPIFEVGEDSPKDMSMFQFDNNFDTTPKSVRAESNFAPIKEAEDYERSNQQSFGALDPIIEESPHKKLCPNDRSESSKSTEKSESDTLNERAVKQMSGFPFFGINIRSTQEDDVMQCQKAVNANSAFSADLFDRNGNKVTAIFFGDKAESFFHQFQSNATHVFTNINTNMSVEKM